VDILQIAEIFVYITSDASPQRQFWAQIPRFIARIFSLIGTSIIPPSKSNTILRKVLPHFNKNLLFQVPAKKSRVLTQKKTKSRRQHMAKIKVVRECELRMVGVCPREGFKFLPVPVHSTL